MTKKLVMTEEGKERMLARLEPLCTFLADDDMLWFVSAAERAANGEGMFGFAEGAAPEIVIPGNMARCGMNLPFPLDRAWFAPVGAPGFTDS